MKERKTINVKKKKERNRENKEIKKDKRIKK